MNEKEILNKIVEEDGNCCWSNESTCKNCPMSKLKQKPDGTYLSCIESIGIEFLSEEQADAKYKAVAEKLLLNQAIDDLLGETDVVN